LSNYIGIRRRPLGEDSLNPVQQTQRSRIAESGPRSSFHKPASGGPVAESTSVGKRSATT
jgi:hypothetical protein